MSDREKMYRRQLGGAEAALRRERQKVMERDALLRAVLDCATDTVWVGECETLLDRMRELGIEVES